MKGKGKREGGATDLSTYNKFAGEETKMGATKRKVNLGKASLLALLALLFFGGWIGGVYDSNGGRGEKRKKLCQT